MRLRLAFTTAMALAIPGVASADMVTPGFSRVPHDFIFEIETDFPGHRFWLSTPRGLEPLDLAPGRPCRTDGEGRTGVYELAYIVVTPAGLVDEMGAAKFHELLWKHELPPGVIRSNQFSFRGEVPFFDTRERVIDRYRVEFEPGKEVRLVLLERNTGNPWVKRAWAAAGILTAVSIGLASLWVFRRFLRLVRRPTVA